MSIFSFEQKYEKELKKNKTQYEKNLERAVKQAQIDDKKMEEYFSSEGAEIFLKYLKEDRDILIRSMRSKLSSDDLRSIKERYAIRCEEIEMIEMYIDRVKSTS